jgi:hypothetical protein
MSGEGLLTAGIETFSHNQDPEHQFAALQRHIRYLGSSGHAERSVDPTRLTLAV